MCDWCQTDSDFEHQALNAPGEYSPVYVTNRDTNETRKYDRTFIVNDLVGGTEVTTIVTTADFPAAEKAVFDQAVAGANVIFVQIPREDLTGIFPNLGDQDSVVGDIANGSIDNEVINTISLEIERRNLLPSRTSVSSDAGVQIAGTGGNVGSGETIRIRDLNIVIIYSDGSTISVRRRGSDGKFVNWSVKDAEGNQIPVEATEPGGNVPISLGAFVNNDFFFGGSGSQLAGLALADLVSTGTGAQCTVAQLGEGITRVTCSTP